MENYAKNKKLNGNKLSIKKINHSTIGLIMQYELLFFLMYLQKNIKIKGVIKITN